MFDGEVGCLWVPYFLQLPPAYIFFCEVSDPAIIGDGDSHVKDPALIFFSLLSDPAIIRGVRLLEETVAIRGNTVFGWNG